MTVVTISVVVRRLIKRVATVYLEDRGLQIKTVSPLQIFKFLHSNFSCLSTKFSKIDKILNHPGTKTTATRREQNENPG